MSRSTRHPPQRAAIAFALAMLGACALDEDSARPTYDAVEVAAAGDAATEIDFGGGDGFFVVPGSMCACATQACREDWIREHVGCGLCIIQVCGDEDVHACVLCDDWADLPPTASTTHHAELDPRIP